MPPHPSYTRIVDLSGVSPQNLELIVKKAVHFVEKNRATDGEIIGLGFKSIPTSEAGAVTISFSKEGKGRKQKRYSPPPSYRDQLSLSCFLLAVSLYLDLGKRAFILCTNSRARGDFENSISTKHPKSKLQEKIRNIMEDGDLIKEFSESATIEAPSDLSSAQKELIERATSGRVSLSATMQIVNSCEIDELELYAQWKSMDFIEGIDGSSIPSHVEFQKIPIDKVVEMMEDNSIVKLKQKEIDSLKSEISSKRKELSRVLSRGLIGRILNR